MRLIQLARSLNSHDLKVMERAGIEILDNLANSCLISIYMPWSIVVLIQNHQIKYDDKGGRK
jgi:hypothetical protein